MERLVVSGWEYDESALLQALREHAGLEKVAVGDQHAVNLVRARSATRLSCYQHVRQMVRDQDYEALLLAGPEHAEDVTTTAVVHGADLLLLGDRMDAEALQAAATASLRHGGALAILRPMLRSAGFSFITDLIDAEPRWSPSVVSLDLWDERPAEHVLRDAIAATTRLMATAPVEVIASTAGDRDQPSTIAVHLRGADGTMTSITAHGMRDARSRLSADAPSGAIELDSAEGESRICLTSPTGERERTTLRDFEPLTLEAQRVARIRRGEALDARFALREAAILRATEESLATGTPASVGESSMRSVLRLLSGGISDRAQQATRHASPRLHVVAGSSGRE